MNQKRQKKRRKRRKFRRKRPNSAKSAIGQPQAMELIDEIHSSAEEEEENGAEEVIFVCTSTASESADESDEIQQQTQRQQQIMELVDEIHSSDEEISLLCTSAAAETAEETDETQQKKRREQRQISGSLEELSLADKNGGTSFDPTAEEQQKERRVFLPLTQKFLPAFPMFDEELSDGDDFDGAFNGPPTEVAKLSDELKLLSPSERAKALLHLFSDFSSDERAEEWEHKSALCAQSVRPMPSPPIGEDDSEEIVYVGTIKR